jgi:AcrR family transcriptional regulator
MPAYASCGSPWEPDLNGVKIQIAGNLNGVKMEEEHAAPARPAYKRSGATGRQRYHHGALKDALVAAAEAILLESGVSGFSLRAAARRAGVSPSAPAHHFGDAAGLLAEVAARGFEELAKDLRDAEERGGSDPAARLRELGTAYIAFALRHPARVRLMFRRDMYDPRPGRLKQAGDEAFALLEKNVRAFCGIAPEEACDPRTMGLILAAWSMVHGFAQLALDGAIDVVANDMGDLDTILSQMLSAMLSALTVSPPSK